MRPARSLLALAALVFLTPVTSQADWQVSSQFLLHLPETIFDSLIQDFWQSLQGTQTVPVGNFDVNLGNTQLAINNVSVAVNYSFPAPTRVSGANTREWQLQSNSISANVTVGQLLITEQQTIFVGGVPVGTTVNVECDNISLSLPAGQASVAAEISASIVNNQVQLAMPSFNATWPANAWQVNAINCPAFADVGQTVQTQILAYLSNSQSLNAYIAGALESEFAKWSQQASVLLLSQENLPTGLSYLTATFQPATATDEAPNGLVLGGTLSFDYPYVSQGQHFEQDFDLPEGTAITPQANPQLLVPFAAIKAMLVGEYFAGQLSYTM